MQGLDLDVLGRIHSRANAEPKPQEDLGSLGVDLTSYDVMQATKASGTWLGPSPWLGVREMFFG